MRIVLASAAAALAVFASPAIANTKGDVVEVRVAYGDLDINSAAGRAALEARIEREVRQACEVRAPLGRQAPQTDWDCVATAKSEALAQVDRRNNDATRTAMGAE